MWWSPMPFAALFPVVLHSGVLFAFIFLQQPVVPLSLSCSSVWAMYWLLWFSWEGKGRGVQGALTTACLGWEQMCDGSPRTRCCNALTKTRLPGSRYVTTQLEHKIKRGGEKKQPSLFGHLSVKLCHIGILFPLYCLPMSFTFPCKSAEWSSVKPLFLHSYIFSFKGISW